MANWRQASQTRCATDKASDRAIAVAMPILAEPGHGEVRLVKDLEGMQTNGRILDSRLVRVGFDEGLMWQYEGGKYLQFRQEGPLVFLSTDGGPEKLVGLKLKEPNQLVLLDTESRNRQHDRLAIWCYIQPPGELSQLQCADRITFFQQVNPADLKDLNPLAGLEKLNLGSCRNVSDLQPVADLKNLRELNLAVCRGISDISPLGHLEKIEMLDLSAACGSVSGIEALAGLVNLRRLNLSRCGLISDLKPLG